MHFWQLTTPMHDITPALMEMSNWNMLHWLVTGLILLHLFLANRSQALMLWCQQVLLPLLRIERDEQIPDDSPTELVAPEFEVEDQECEEEWTSFKTQAELFVQSFENVPGVDVSLPSHNWSMGCATDIGQRAENQDFAICCSLNDHVYLAVLSDGCGGHPNGSQASRCCAIAAATSIVRFVACHEGDLSEIDWEPVAKNAICMSSDVIAAEVAMTGFCFQESTRSTCLIAIATHDTVTFAASGDGGAWMYELPQRQIQPILSPSYGHLLRSSVGPVLDGEVTTVTIPWPESGFFLMASDGVSDIIEAESFLRAAQLSLVDHQGDVQKSSLQLLNLLKQFGQTDDNMTLAIICRPQLSRQRPGEI